MIQHTYSENSKNINSEVIQESNVGVGRLLLTLPLKILKTCFYIIRKITASIGIGFQIFVSGAEQHGTHRR